MEKTIDGLVVRKTKKRRKIGFEEPIKRAPLEDFSDGVPEKNEGLDTDNGVKGIEKSATEEFLSPVESFDFKFDSKEIKKAAKRAKKEQKKARRLEKKQSKKRRVVKIVLLFLLLIILSGTTWLMLWGNDIIRKITGENSDIWSAIGAVVSETYEPLKEDENGRTNILAFGTSGYDMGGSGHSGAQLTDSIMLVSLDQKTGDTVMVSLPRDLKIWKTCTATGKINEVYWCNNQSGKNEEAGAQAIMRVVEDVLGVDIQYYAHINWGALVSIVDMVGGITVTLDENIKDYNYTKCVIKAGVPTTLNGEQALGLARARHGVSGGDFSRGASQQKILIALKDKLLEKQLGLTEALGLVGTLGDNLRTNFSTEEIKTGLHIAKEFDMGTARQLTLSDWSKKISYVKTANINGISYVVPSAGIDNYSEIQKYLAHEMISDPVVREEAKILLLNGSDQTGVATQAGQELEKESFIISYISDAPEKLEKKGYHVYLINEEKKLSFEALKKHYEEGGKKVYEHAKEDLQKGVDTKNYDIVIVVGGITKTD